MIAKLGLPLRKKKKKITEMEKRLNEESGKFYNLPMAHGFRKCQKS